MWCALLKVQWVIYDKHNPHTLNHSLNGQYLFSEQELKDRTVFYRSPCVKYSSSEETNKSAVVETHFVPITRMNADCVL